MSAFRTSTPRLEQIYSGLRHPRLLSRVGKAPLAPPQLAKTFPSRAVFHHVEQLSCTWYFHLSLSLSLYSLLLSNFKYLHIPGPTTRKVLSTLVSPIAEASDLEHSLPSIAGLSQQTHLPYTFTRLVSATAQLTAVEQAADSITLNAPRCRISHSTHSNNESTSLQG